MARFIQGDRPEAIAELAMTGWKLARLFLGVALPRPLPVIASSAPSSSRSPWMKRAFRFSVYSGRFSRTNDQRSEATQGPRDATPGLFRRFAPRSDDPA